MIRTAFAFAVLFGCLLVTSSCVQQCRADEGYRIKVQPVGLFRNSPGLFRRNSPEPRSDYGQVRAIDGTDLRSANRFKPPNPIPLPANPVADADDVISHPRTGGKSSAGTAKDGSDFGELTSEMIELADRVRKCLNHYYKQPEDAGSRSPWGIMHHIIAYGVDAQVIANGQKANAIAWLCWNGSCRGQQLFHLSNGRLNPAEGPGVQGHAGQLLAVLAQSRVKRDYPILVSGKEFTIEDLIEHEKRTCYAGTELTFKLIGLSHYLDSDETWQNQYGEDWSISRLIDEELKQSVIGAACGGTHRMMGFSYSLNRRSKQGKPLTGQFFRAKAFVDDYHEYTFRLQNPDGSFSTNWFEGRGDWGGPDKRLQTTGHILEWLVFSLPQEQLSDPRVVRAVDYLTNLMLDNRSNSWEVGPRGHALKALVLYNQRVFGDLGTVDGERVADRDADSLSE